MVGVIATLYLSEVSMTSKKEMVRDCPSNHPEEERHCQGQSYCIENLSGNRRGEKLKYQCTLSWAELSGTGQGAEKV